MSSRLKESRSTESWNQVSEKMKRNNWSSNSWMDAIKKECKRSNDSTAKVLVRSPSPKIQTQKARNLDKSRVKELQLPKKCKILSQALTTGSNQWQHLTAAMSAKMNQQLPLHQSQYQKKLKWRVVEPIRNPRQTSTSISTNNPINRNQISQPNPSTLMTYWQVVSLKISQVRPPSWTSFSLTIW